MNVDRVSSDGPPGVLLVGHGTRDPRGQAEFAATSEQIAALRPDWLVEPCHLELVPPTLADGFARLVERGAVRIAVAPVLIAAAGHVRRDIPAQCRQQQDRCPLVAVTIAENLGCHEGLLALAAERFAEAVSHARVPQHETVLILVARGSSDADGVEEHFKFARRLATKIDVTRVDCAFAAVARPTLDEALAAAAACRPKCVVVQPHLLYAGQVLAEVTRFTESARRRNPAIQWIVASHLGPDPAVALAVIDRVEIALCGQPSVKR